MLDRFSTFTLAASGGLALAYIVLSEILTRKRRRVTSNISCGTSFLGADVFSSTPKKCIIIGGGVSGLLVAFICKERGIPFELYEKSSERVGGLLGSTLILSNDGKEIGLAEQAANGVMWTPEVERLCEKIGIPLGMGEDGVVSPKSTAKARFFVRQGKMVQFPLSIMEILHVLCWRMWQLPSSDRVFETMEEYLSFYFGNTMTRQLLEPAFSGIFGTTLDRLSLQGTTEIFPKLLNYSVSFPLALTKYLWYSVWEGKKVKQTVRKPGTQSFKFGMQQFINALTNYVGRENIFYGSAVEKLSQFGTDTNIILTTPAHVSCEILRNSFSDLSQWQKELIHLLEKIDYTPIITCTIIMERRKLPGLKPGFGCLLPRNEGLSLLGVLFNSDIFENRVKDEGNYISLTTILQDTELESTDESVKRLILSELSTLFSNGSYLDEDSVQSMKLFRWRHGIPQYSPTLSQSWPVMDSLLKQHLPNVNLFGNYTGQISIRGMIREAMKKVM